MLGLDGDTDAAARMLEGLAGRTDDLKRGLRDIGDELRDRNADTFRSRGGRSRWDALDPATVKRKRNRRVLVDTGGLLRSLTMRRYPGAIERVNSDSIFAGTKNKTATLHKRGTKVMPKRDPVPKVTKAEREEWSAMLLDHLLGDTR